MKESGYLSERKALDVGDGLLVPLEVLEKDANVPGANWSGISQGEGVWG